MSLSATAAGFIWEPGLLLRRRGSVGRVTPAVAVGRLRSVTAVTGVRHRKLHRKACGQAGTLSALGTGLLPASLALPPCCCDSLKLSG